MATLNCENLNLLFESLSEILNLDVATIKDFLGTADEKKWEESSYSYFEEYLLAEVCKISKHQVSLDKTCWFHLTRTWKDNRFETGILPLKNIIDSIWGKLYLLVNCQVSKQEWFTFREDMNSGKNHNHFAKLYRMKLEKDYLGGPYGMLIRDVAFIPKSLANHDYLYVPEIVDDICRCFESEFNITLRNKFIANTSPCIVKFFQHGGDVKNVGTTLHFAYSILNKQPLSFMCNNCFDGKGVRVPNSDILKIEFIEEAPQNTPWIVGYAENFCNNHFNKNTSPASN